MHTHKTLHVKYLSWSLILNLDDMVHELQFSLLTGLHFDSFVKIIPNLRSWKLRYISFLALFNCNRTFNWTIKFSLSLFNVRLLFWDLLFPPYAFPWAPFLYDFLINFLICIMHSHVLVLCNRVLPLFALQLSYSTFSR